MTHDQLVQGAVAFVEGVVDGTMQGATSVMESALDLAAESTGEYRERARKVVVQLCPRDSCGENGHCTALQHCNLRPPLDELVRR